MAYGNRGNRNDREHAFQRIERDIKSGNIPGIVLLCGKEDYLTDHYKKVLLDHLVDPAARQFDLTEFAGESVRADDIAEEAETLPLMSQKKVILLSGLINASGRYPKQIDQSQTATDELLETIGSLPEHTVLIISCDKPRTTGDYRKQSDGSKLGKLIRTVNKAGGSSYEFDTLDQAQLRNFVIKRFRKAGKNCTNGVLQRICYDSGYGSRYSDYDLYLLDNDLKKMIAYTGEKATVSEDDTLGILTISPENNVFHMLDAISRGRRDQALIDLNKLMEAGESEFAVLSNIVRQVELMLISRELMDENVARGEILKYLQKKEKVGEYRGRKVLETAARFRGDHLRKMLAGALRVEENIKGGIMDARLALEYYISA